MLELKELKSCPFCGGKGSLSFRDYGFLGQNDFGDKKLKYRVQIICNRCKSRGKPIVTDALINPNPWVIRFMDEGKWKETEFAPYIDKAIEAWNKRDGEQE